FSVASADGTLTAVTINILGTNDAAVLTATTKNLTDTNLTADTPTAATLTISDVDSPTTLDSHPATAATHCTFALDSAVSWTYTASSAHHDFSPAPRSSDLFSVASADGTLTAVTINILGTNDAAVLTVTGEAFPNGTQNAAAPSGAVGTLV